MALPTIVGLECIVFLLAAMVDATPPGIANHPAQASCKIKKYKMCYNLPHVCPKFCPDACEVECASCKPICTPGSSPPSGSDTGSSPPPYVPSPPEESGGDGKDGGKKGGGDDSSDGKGTGDGKKGGDSPLGGTPPFSPPAVDPVPPTPSTYSPPSIPSSPPPSTPSPSTPSYSPPLPHVDPSPPTYSPPALPSSPSPSIPSPSTPSYSPPPPVTPSAPSTPTPSPPTPTPPTPSSPSPVTPILSPPTPTPPTPSSPSPVTPIPSTPSSSYPKPSGPPSGPTPSPSTPTTPASSGVAARKRVRCTKKDYGACYGQEFTCPDNCAASCQVDCNSCKPVCSCDYPGAVCQDPRFIGGDGLTFYFHGKKDRDFCLVTDPALHINAHFIGKRNPAMTRDFTWVQSLGILFNNHRLYIGALKTDIWNPSNDRLSLTFDDIPIFLPETPDFQWRSSTTPQVTITRTSNANNVVIQVHEQMSVTVNVVPITKEESRAHNYDIRDDDCFAHLDVGFKFYSLSKGVDGVLGKTYRDDYVSKVNMGAAMSVMGGNKEYSTSNLFATDCLVSRFSNGGGEDGSLLEKFDEFASMNCASTMDGEGVVCKR